MRSFIVHNRATILSFGFIAVLVSAGVVGAEEATTTDPTATSTVETIVPLSPVEQLRNRIAEKNQQIGELEKEIAGYQKEIDKVGAEAKTLSNQVKATNAAIASLSGDIRITQRRVEATELRLEELDIAIHEKEGQIGGLRRALAELLRTLYERESQSLFAVLLAHATLSSFFGDLENVQDLGGSVERELDYLKAVRENLAAEVALRDQERRSLVVLRRELTDQKIIEENTKKEKSVLLTQTKSREAAFEAQLREREELRATLAAEIEATENELRKLIDPSALPIARSGVLSWPIVGAVLTQSFGNTPYAQILYDGKPHNGIDIRARSGTRVLAADDGVVWETGDTDAFLRCLSYGKWVLVRHPNNFATLYAHLSLIKVSKGDTIKRGEIIAYSGYSGYTVPAGPAGAHLHFTVYDASTVRFGPSRSSRSTCEFLPFGGYLNPLAYL
ncbi:MAG: peptidoglycan DD-metalloendopeptidase family protein [Candidatus Niyogibacteria bacterium]|nr:peptidoglycan DD-metalloendopeptidase family protein [Candidatus Niyogibacteria bacterium]